jgi:predicted nucleic acid-binding protein
MIVGAYAAVLDACVLHPVWLRGALLWMAEEGLFRPLWSEQILDEWTSSVVRRYPAPLIKPMASQRAALTDNFTEALVHIPKAVLTQKVSILPDPKDDHVLYAAIRGRADAIVTANLKDFPASILNEHQIEVRHPDDFLLDMINLDGQRALAALQNHRRSLTKTTPSAADYVDRARACQLIRTHAKLLEFVDVL